LTGRALLNAQLDALSSDRLLGDDASQYQPIKVTPSVEMFCMSELSRALRLPVSHAIDVRYKGEAPPILGRLLAAFDDKANHPENFDPLADLLGDYSPAALLEALVRELGELAGKIATVSVIAAIENKFVTFNTLTLTGRLPADQERIRLRERVHSESICWRLVEFADDATVLSWAIYDWGWAFPVVHVRTLFSHRERHPSRQTRQSLYEFCEKLARNVRRFGIGLPLQMVSAAWENGIPRPA
jgi:hypothetical protein